MLVFGGSGRAGRGGGDEVASGSISWAGAACSCRPWPSSSERPAWAPGRRLSQRRCYIRAADAG